MGITMKITQDLVAIALMAAASAAWATPQTNYYIYDESGHVIGEYDANGNPVQEHIYLGDRPVAVVQGQGGSVGYVTTDQLGTPRAVTDSNQNIQEKMGSGLEISVFRTRLTAWLVRCVSSIPAPSIM